MLLLPLASEGYILVVRLPDVVPLLLNTIVDEKPFLAAIAVPIHPAAATTETSPTCC
jgi:hypothetical protein